VVDPADDFSDLPIDEMPAEPVAVPEPVVVEAAPVVEPAVVEEQPRAPAQGGGLAGAIARTREVKQELEKTRRQQAQAQGVRRI
jgi:hypothetical protein